MSERIRNYMIALTIALIGALYLAMINPSETWGEDSFMYIHHAINIADGVKYDNLGLVLNPKEMINPSSLPPVLPLLLAPVYKIFGLNIPAMKAEICFVFLIFMFLLVLLFRNRFSFASLLGLLIIFSIHPSMLKFTDILSDIPFLLFTYWTLLLIHKFYGSEYSRTGIIPALYLGLVMYLSYGTRSAGAILLPCLLAYEFIHWRRISSRTIITIGMFLFLAAIQWIFLHNEGGYFKILLGQDMLFAVRNNLHYFSLFWYDGDHPKVQIVLLSSVLFFAVSGFITQVRRGLLVTEIFFIFYWLSIFSWPDAYNFRYFLPILPLFIFYLLCGMEFWGSKPVRTTYAVLRAMIFIGCLGALVFSYGSRYHGWDYYHAIPVGPYKQESQELFRFIRGKTPPDAVFIFIKPAVLAFFTDRHASVYHYPANQEELWQYMHDIGAQYLIQCNLMIQDKAHQQYLNSFIERYQKQLKVVFVNKDFQIFEKIE